MLSSRRVVRNLTVAALLGLPASLVSQAEQPAAGFAVSVRASGRSLQDLASSAAGAPQFVVGVRRERFALGLGVGFVLARSSDRDEFDGATSEQTLSGTAFQVGPSALLDIWRSADGRVRGQLAGGVAIGRASLTETDEFRDPGGVQRSESEVSGTLLSFHAGLGAEHFLHPHFALGLEAGVQGTFALGVEEAGVTNRMSFGATGTYGALRAMVVF